MKRFAVIIMALFAATAALAQGNYQVRAGDTLRIEVLEDASLNRNALVLPDGRIQFPFVGSVRAAGRTISQIERAITTGLASNFASEPNVFVAVQNIPDRSSPFPPQPVEDPVIDVYVIGEVNSPGLKEVKPGTTLLQFLAEAGGFTKFAATKRVQLRRRDAASGRQQLFQIDYRALSNGAALNRDIVLQPGDVVLVPERRLFE